MKPILSCRNLSKSYTSPKPVELFSNIDLDIYPEDTLAIVGRSGEGKSTLLHLLGILDTPSSARRSTSCVVDRVEAYVKVHKSGEHQRVQLRC
ncbi:MAG: ATP-binding cassette domain-containing protein, partial [Parachlamydiaceae bacterium]